MLVCGVSGQGSHHVPSYLAVVAEDELFSFFIITSCSPEQRTLTEDRDNISHSDSVIDIFERFKKYKVESLSSSLMSQTVT